MSRDFLLQVFFINHLPQAPEKTLGSFQLLKKFASQGAPPVSTTPAVNFAMVPLVLLIPVSTKPAVNFLPVSTAAVDNNWKYIRLLTTLEKIDLYVNSTTHRCPNKTIKTILIDDYLYLPPAPKTPVVHLKLPISLRIFELRNGTNGILKGAGGKLSNEKN